MNTIIPMVALVSLGCVSLSPILEYFCSDDLYGENTVTTIKLILVMFLATSSILFTTPKASLAYIDGDTDTTGICNPSYVDIDGINFVLSADIPQIEEAQIMADFENMFKKKNIQNLKKEGFSIEVSKQRNPQRKNILNVTFYLSYAAKEDFTLPLASNVLVLWTELETELSPKRENLYNRIQQELPSFLRTTLKGDSIKLQSKVNYLTFDDVGHISPSYFGGIMSGNLSNVLCSVFYNNAGKYCANSNSFSYTDLKPVKKACIQDIK